MFLSNQRWAQKTCAASGLRQREDKIPGVITVDKFIRKIKIIIIFSYFTMNSTICCVKLNRYCGKTLEMITVEGELWSKKQVE